MEESSEGREGELEKDGAKAGVLIEGKNDEAEQKRDQTEVKEKEGVEQRECEEWV